MLRSSFFIAVCTFTAILEIFWCFMWLQTLPPATRFEVLAPVAILLFCYCFAVMDRARSQP
jgi:hypothetical protein